MSEQPLVSVVITAYNRAWIVSEAIDSVLRQTYKNVEIVVVDDGSSDNLAEVLEPYGDKIKCYSKDHGGCASALNKGYEMASADYIALLDSDDVWHEEKLEKQIKALTGPGDFDLCINDIQIMDEDSNYLRLTNLRKHIPKDGIIFEDMLRQPPMTSSYVMFHRRVMDYIGPFSETLKTGIDYDFLMRASAFFRFAVIAEPLTYYRYSPDSMKKLFSGSRLTSLTQFQEKFPEKAAEYANEIKEARARYHLNYADDLLWHRYIKAAQCELKQSLAESSSSEAWKMLIKSYMIQALSLVVPKYRDKGERERLN